MSLRFFTSVFLASFLSLAVHADDGKKSQLPNIRSSTSAQADPPVPPAPTPPVVISPIVPESKVDLIPAMTYVIKNADPLLIVPSTKGIVEITVVENLKEVPVILRSEFPDSKGKVELRVFTNKYIYLISSNATGSCDLLVSLVGAKSEDEIQRVAVTATSKNVVVVDDKKGDNKKPDPLIGKPRRLQVVVVESTDEARINRSSYFTDPGLVEAIKSGNHYVPQVVSLNAKATGPNGETIPAPDAQPYINEAKKYTLPRIFLVDPTAKPNVIYSGDCPDPAGLTELIKKLGGSK